MILDDRYYRPLKPKKYFIKKGVVNTALSNALRQVKIHARIKRLSENQNASHTTHISQT